MTWDYQLEQWINGPTRWRSSSSLQTNPLPAIRISPDELSKLGSPPQPWHLSSRTTGRSAFGPQVARFPYAGTLGYEANAPAAPTIHPLPNKGYVRDRSLQFA